jgi:hypothetical protein
MPIVFAVYEYILHDACVALCLYDLCAYVCLLCVVLYGFGDAFTRDNFVCVYIYIYISNCNWAYARWHCYINNEEYVNSIT